MRGRLPLLPWTWSLADRLPFSTLRVSLVSLGASTLNRDATWMAQPQLGAARQRLAPSSSRRRAKASAASALLPSPRQGHGLAIDHQRGTGGSYRWFGWSGATPPTGCTTSCRLSVSTESRSAPWNSEEFLSERAYFAICPAVTVPRDVSDRIPMIQLPDGRAKLTAGLTDLLTPDEDARFSYPPIETEGSQRQFSRAKGPGRNALHKDFRSQESTDRVN